MAEYNATINHEAGSSTAYMSGGGVSLNYGDTLVISVGSGFSAGTEVSALGFFNAVNGRKGATPKGNWSRSGTSSIPAGLSITGNADGSVTIEDNDTSADQDYYYNCTAHDPVTGGDYQADPELIVRKKPTMARRSLNRPIAPEV